MVLTESEQFAPFDSSETHYLRTTAGLVINAGKDASLPPGAARIIGQILEYPDPVRVGGGARVSLRQGPWGEDLNGDGVEEGFRLTFTQIFRGTESLTFAGSDLSVLHFSNTVTLTLFSSDPTVPAVTVVTTEESYLAGTFGLVRAIREARDQNGAVIVPRYTLEIDSGTAGGVSWADYLSPPSPVTTLALSHNAIVFDTGRGLYYASVPNGSSTNANSIATVNPASGTVSFSAPLALNPGAMAISSDNSILYVYANNNLIRLALPGLTETGRVPLPGAGFCGNNSAERIAVSPLDASVVAVSLANAGCSPRHEGVVLYRNLVEQLNRTQGHTGSNEIAFAPNGTELFGLNTETTEWGLRRIAVLPNGLTQTSVVATSGNFGINWRTLDASASQIVLGDAVHSTGNLARQGSLPGQSCRLATNRILCIVTPTPGGFALSEQIIVVDPATQLPISTLRFGTNDFVTWTLRLTPGPAGKVAISDTGFTGSLPFTSLRIFSNALLP
jgi:hypothetical protein